MTQRPARVARRVLKVLAGGVGVGALIWSVASAGLYLAMRQPPEAFGAVMARVPAVAMMVLPFKPLWMSARAGSLPSGSPLGATAKVVCRCNPRLLASV